MLLHIYKLHHGGEGKKSITDKHRKRTNQRIKKNSARQFLLDDFDERTMNRVTNLMRKKYRKRDLYRNIILVSKRPLLDIRYDFYASLKTYF